MDIAVSPQRAGSGPSSGGNSSFTKTLAAFGVGFIALLAGAVYLLSTNPKTGIWQQGYDPTGHWWLSTLLAAMPLVVLMGAMAVLKLKAHVAAVIGLATALVIAIFVYQMPVRLAMTTTVYGAATVCFPSAGLSCPSSFSISSR